MSIELIPAASLAVAIVGAALATAILVRFRFNPASQQHTLETSLARLEQALRDELARGRHESVGEMQVLATGVGDLKRILSNVKSRGTWGEVALGNILEEILSADQYARNVEVRPRSNQRVEYAIRLPGDGESPLWLPVDAK